HTFRYESLSNVWLFEKYIWETHRRRKDIFLLVGTLRRTGSKKKFRINFYSYLIHSFFPYLQHYPLVALIPSQRIPSLLRNKYFSIKIYNHETIHQSVVMDRSLHSICGNLCRL